MSIMQEENGVAKLMRKPMYHPDEDGNPQTSQAELVADMLNVMALDNKAIGTAVGVDIEANRVSEQKAALMLQGLVKGEDLELLEKIARLESKNERILEELMEEEEFEAHQQTKRDVVYQPAPPEAHEGEDDGGDD